MSADTINDGGPAFPVQDAATWQAHGMSLRDFFAAAALQGQLVCMVNQKNVDGLIANAEAQGISPKERMVVACYEYADLMLKARSTQ